MALDAQASSIRWLEQRRRAGSTAQADVCKHFSRCIPIPEHPSLAPTYIKKYRLYMKIIIFSPGQMEANEYVQQLDLAEIFTTSMSKLKNDVKLASRLRKYV